MATITTTSGHVNQAWYFYSSDDIFCVLGRTTAWADEMNPDDPEADTTEVDEVIGYKKWEEKKMVVPDPLGTIPFNGSTWRELVTPTIDDAITEKSRWVYLKFIVYPSDLPYPISFRQVGVHDRLTPALGFESQANLVPAEVDDAGPLVLLDNRIAITRVMDQQEVIEYILEF